MTTDPFNSVYQGREGTGAAFLLSGNKAAETFHKNNFIDDQRKYEQEQLRRQQEFLRQKALKSEQELVYKDISSITPKDYWISHEKEILSENEDLKKEGAKIYLATGKSPFNVPEWTSKKDRLLAKAKYSGQLYTQFQELQKVLQQNPDKFSEDSISKVMAYYDPKKTLSKYLDEGAMTPQLKLRYDDSEVIKGIKPASITTNDGNQKITAVNRDGVFAQLYTRLDGKAAQTVLKDKYGVNPTIGAFGDPDQDGLFRTDDEFVNGTVVELLANPSIAVELPKLGITSKEPAEIVTQLSEIVKHQNGGTNNALTKWANDVIGQGDTGSEKSNLNFSRRMQQERLNLAQSRAAKSDANQIDESATYRQKWISDMYDGVSGSGEKLIAAAKGNPEYNGELKIQRINSQPNKIVLRIPEKVTSSTDKFGEVKKKTTPGRTITLDKNNADDKITLNQIISEITKENVNVSQLMTPGGKKIIKGEDGATKMTQPSEDPLNLF